MGTKIDLKTIRLPLQYTNLKLIATVDGISDSVYYLGDKFILKVFEQASTDNIQNEIMLLEMLKDLKVSTIIDQLIVNEKRALIYTKIEGESVRISNHKQIEQIGKFLKSFHKITKNKTSTNKQLFTKNNLEKLVQATNEPTLKYHLHKVNCELKNDGIIHGDLFYDNAKFDNNILKGVYDFSEACNGDFIFDLAVIALSWCYDNNQLNEHKLTTLKKSYELKINSNDFKEYIKYALVYYAATRHLNNQNYQELLTKLDSLK
ncbi:MAG: phosphotransferase [Campylobacterota bacterium]|nr:phosphotransferase [Campylobacterota bacterium]